jgi:hypothetical protein
VELLEVDVAAAGSPARLLPLWFTWHGFLFLGHSDGVIDGLMGTCPIWRLGGM